MAVRQFFSNIGLCAKKQAGENACLFLSLIYGWFLSICDGVKTVRQDQAGAFLSLAPCLQPASRTALRNEKTHRPPHT